MTLPTRTPVCLAGGRGSLLNTGGKALVAMLATASCTLILSSCVSGERGDEGAIGSGTSQYPLGDTGLNQRYEEQNKAIRQLGL